MSSAFPTMSDTNLAVWPQKMATLKILDISGVMRKSVLGVFRPGPTQTELYM